MTRKEMLEAAGAEAVVRASEARYRRIVEAVPLSIWEEDWTEVIALLGRARADSGSEDFASYRARHPEIVGDALKEVRILDVNPRTLEMFRAKDKGQLLASLETIFATEDTRPAFVGELAALWEGRREYAAEMALCTVDGAPIQVMLTMSFPHPESDSGLVLVSLMDVTDKKRAEETLALYAAELERSNEDLQEFAFVASHDLQEPLRKIAVFAERLRGRAAEALDEPSLDYLARMERAAERMSRLIESLLELSRVTSQARPFEATDLAAVVAEVLIDLEEQVRVAGARVDTGPLPVVTADPGQMRRLFQNLITNALKFREPGRGPSITVRSEPAGANRWRVTVQDDGIGFEERFADRIFKPFQRLHGRNAFEGSGMGLAICRKIAARHGTDIAVRSQPGTGSAFSVTLPDGSLAKGA